MMLDNDPEPECEELASLSDEEKAAAVKYGAASGLFHLAYQADHSMTLGYFPEYLAHQRHLPMLTTATQKFRLKSAATLYSGHGNSSGLIGGLYDNPAERFKGLTWQYRGVTSTSSMRWRAIDFMEKRSGGDLNGPALLTFKLPAGFKLLPMSCLGSLSSHEAEYLLPPATKFTITSASIGPIDASPKVLQLVLEP